MQITSKCICLISLFFVVLFSHSNLNATVFVQDNFDSQPNTYAGGTCPSGWVQWMGSGSSSQGGVTHYAGEISSPGRGGTGKSLKLWRYGSLWDGYAGSLVDTLSTNSSNLYVRWYVKIPVAMDIVSNVNYQKLWRFNTSPSGEIYLDFYGSGSSMRNTGALTIETSSGGKVQVIPSGRLPSTVWDGNWHCWEFQLGLNNSTLKFWLDGNLYYSNTSYSWPGVAGQKFNNYLQHFPLGNRAGNPLSSYQNSWQAFEVDDLVIADSYIGPVGGGGGGSADTTAPNVSLTEPASGATVQGTVSLAATASDNVGVAGVQFKLDGANLGAEDTTNAYSVSWNTTTASSGTHVLTAVARDAAGNTKTSSSVTVTVSNSTADTTAPNVSLTAPASGAIVQGTVSLAAAASDNVGVAGVQFKLDGADLGAEDTSNAYSVSWNTTTASSGTHVLTAVARDAAGNTKTSSSVSVTVSNSTADTTAPNVSLTAPASGTTVQGTVSLAATASDNVGVAGVQFKVDGANVGAEDTTNAFSVSWNTSTISNGTHVLTAVARDAAGNTKTSSSVTVTVSNSSSSSGNLLFQELFEDSNFSSRGWYDGNFNRSTAEHISGSTGSAAFRFQQGATMPDSGTAVRKQFTATDSVYFSYYIKHSSNWVGSGVNYHPHMFYMLTNKDDAWSNLAFNHLTAYVEHIGGVPQMSFQDGANIDQSRIGQNLISITEARGVTGCNGDSDGYGAGDCYKSGTVYVNGKHWRADGVYFSNSAGPNYKGDWHFVEVYMKLNSISSGKAVKDGIIKYWQDGNLLIDHSNVVMRTGQYPDMKFNQFVIAPYIGNGSPVDQTFWIDNLTVRTSKESSNVLSPPTGLRVQQ